MKFYLKTKEECDKIVENSESFYRADRVVMGYNVAIFDYRLASLSDFVDNEAFELRGLTFVEDDNGVWHRNIVLQKFFNISQTEGYMIEDVQDKKITRVQNKEDGSVISFVKFPNNVIRAKSKASFESPQADMAQKIFVGNDNIRNFVESSINMDVTPIFELCSPLNQIVLEYQNTDLILLQMRNNLTGEYIPLDSFNTENITVTEDFTDDSWTLENLLARKEIDQSNIEGWVVTFEDGQMAKIKTDKYIQLHGLIGPDAFRENLLVQTILDGNIDDVIAQLVPGEKKDMIMNLETKVGHKFNLLVKEYIKLRGEYFNKFQENRAEFAKIYSNEGTKPHPLFGSIMKSLKTSFRDVEETAELEIKEFISRQTKSLGDAKKWVSKL